MELYRDFGGDLDYERDGIEIYGVASVTDESGSVWTADFSGHMEGPDACIDEVSCIEITHNEARI